MKVTKVSIIVPALNEVATIQSVVKRLANLSLGVPYEVIIIDDGSTDGTTEFLKREKRKSHKNFSYIFHSKSQGKGAAIISALTFAKGSHIAIQDADEEYDPQELKKLIEEANKHRMGVVYGSRNKDIRNKYLYPLFYWGAKALSTCINVLYHQQLTDPVTCSKLIPTELLKFIRITETGFGVEMEITCKIGSLGIKISEVSITYNPRSFAQGKKIRAKDGVRSLYLIIKFWMTDLHYGVIDRILRRIRENKVLSEITVTNKMVVADMGCGRQAHLGWRLRTKISKYIGVDKEVENQYIDNIQLIKKDIDKFTEIHIRNIDMVVMCAVIEHLKNPERFIKVSRSMLKKGGLLCITTPHPATDTFLHFISRFHVIDPAEIHEHRFYFTAENLKKVLEKHGFKTIIAQQFFFGMNGLIIGKKI